MGRTVCLIAFICCARLLAAQEIKILATGIAGSFRGLSVVDDRVVWVSGSNGKVGRSVDGGANWKWMTVAGYEKRDFRDIEAFDGAVAVIMAVGEPAVILRTTDGGSHWQKVYENSKPGMFLDAMAFWNEESGIVIGDPIKGRFFIARSFDNGKTWQELSFTKLPAADSGEACFAASGTNIKRLNLEEACFVSGGAKSRFFRKDTAITLPLAQGGQSAGANSIAVRNDKKRRGSNYFVAVGGDFNKDTDTTGNCALSRDGGKTWFRAPAPPNGYRSCVEFITQSRLVTCGTSGVDVSEDGGPHWRPVSREGFHVCQRAKRGKKVFLAGNGRVAELIW